MATVELDGQECLADEEISQLFVHKPSGGKNNVLQKPFADYSPSQQVEILCLRLNFLQRCRSLKRPPPTLRIKGASAIPDQSKLYKFSLLESELLDLAICSKIKDIKNFNK